LSLRRLRISNWDGSEPRFAAGKENRVQMVDGTVHFGAIKSFSPDTSSLVIMKEGAELPLPVDQVASLVLAVDEECSNRSPRCDSCGLGRWWLCVGISCLDCGWACGVAIGLF
jgi:hypothetical protein